MMFFFLFKQNTAYELRISDWSSDVCSAHLLAAGFPADRQAVAIETPARSYSWADIEQTSARLANFLASLDLPPGSRVAVQVHKSPEAAMLYLATLRAGLVYLPLNTAYRSAEVE